MTLHKTRRRMRKSNRFSVAWVAREVAWAEAWVAWAPFRRKYCLGSSANSGNVMTSA